MLKLKAFLQVCIGFNIHRGCSVIPKSVNAARIVENFNSANLQLDEEDMKCLKGMDKNSRFLPVCIFKLL